MNTAQLLINGELRDAQGGQTFKRINPVTGEVATVAAAAQPADVAAAIEAAEQAFKSWSALGPTERRQRLLRAADLMVERSADFIRIARQETGSTDAWYGFNAQLAANILREAAGMTTQVQGAVIPSDVPGNLSLSMRVPCGVVLSIAPWNAPMILSTRAIAMPIAYGNTVILKASEISPATHVLVGEVLNEAGIGPGVVNILTHAPEDAPAVVEQLIAHRAVKRVNFTGSTQVGRIIATVAAQHLKPTVLELGGKAPAIICADADLEQAVAGVAFGAFFNQGQICMSTERVLVDARIADEFMARLVAKTRDIAVGQPEDPQTTFAYLESEQAAERLRALVEDAVQQGAELPLPLRIEGAQMYPLIVDGIRPEMRLYAEESFGPLLAVMRFNHIDEAIERANDTQYGLSASVYSQNISQALTLAGQIESGICHINGPTVHDEAQAPFGGLKDSGYGRFGSRAAINEFTEERWVTLQSTPRQFPL